VFERYTEKARRAIFFARYEASQYGSPYMETEHLLLGILREDKALTRRFLRSPGTGEMIRRQIDAHTTIREQVPTSVDLPLSDEFKRILAYAAEEPNGSLTTISEPSICFWDCCARRSVLPLKFCTNKDCG
jgi:ATP-dependent Clp protease ATP-binding subunit ClpC